MKVLHFEEKSQAVCEGEGVLLPAMQSGMLRQYYVCFTVFYCAVMGCTDCLISDKPNRSFLSFALHLQIYHQVNDIPEFRKSFNPNLTTQA